jgi:hypothetical protein
MAWLFFAAVLIWIVASALRKPRPTAHDIAANERDLTIQNSELTRYLHTVDRYTSQEFYFPKMLVTETNHPMDIGPVVIRTYNLRRVDATKWQAKRMAESVTAEIAELRRQIEREPDSRDIYEIDIEELKEPLIWVDLGSNVSGGLETQYQRFLMHWKPST